MHVINLAAHPEPVDTSTLTPESFADDTEMKAFKNNNGVDTDTIGNDSETTKKQPKKNTGTLCVAPLDMSDTPGKGHMTSWEPHRSWGTVQSIYKAVVVQIDDDIQEIITSKKGAEISGLSYGQHLLTLTAQGSGRPYFKKKIQVGENPDCLYDNAFYGTTQISDKPRRRFCRKCFKNALSN